MFIETIRSDGLAHLGYLVGDGPAAAAIDPRRDVDIFLEQAQLQEVDITHVLETHRNEDVLVGSVELADRTGASIHHGAHLDFSYGRPTREHDVIELGSIRLVALETPGHTPESLSYVLYDPRTGDSPVAVFTGDTLFVGDVGRTDLAGDDEQAADALFRSLHDKILPLGDQVIVYPAHGAGSVCGEGMADRDVSTIGYERRHNPALRLDADGFRERKLAEHHVVPPYFAEMERANRDGPPPRPRRAIPPLEATAFEAAREGGARVVDVRSVEAFVGSHIPGSLSLPVDLIATYAGHLVPPDRALILVSDALEQRAEAVRRLARVGRERVVGYLAGGIPSWEVSGHPLRQLPVAAGDTLEARATDPEATIVDVRKQTEWDQGHLRRSAHVFLGDLPRHLGLGELPKGRLTTVCGSGQRATVAASLLAAEGREVEVGLGSIAALRARKVPMSSSPELELAPELQ